jgi:hypothetical protein
MDPRDIAFCWAVFGIVEKVKPEVSLDVLKQCVEVLSSKTKTPIPEKPNTPTK